jgi:hypothetical protein
MVSVLIYLCENSSGKFIGDDIEDVRDNVVWERKEEKEKEISELVEKYWLKFRVLNGNCWKEL